MYKRLSSIDKQLDDRAEMHTKYTNRQTLGRDKHTHRHTHTHLHAIMYTCKYSCLHSSFSVQGSFQIQTPTFNSEQTAKLSNGKKVASRHQRRI